MKKTETKKTVINLFEGSWTRSLFPSRTDAIASWIEAGAPKDATIMPRHMVTYESFAGAKAYGVNL